MNYGKAPSRRIPWDQNFLTLDHIIPVCNGGAWANRNLQVLCRHCNQRKGNSRNERARRRILAIA